MIFVGKLATAQQNELKSNIAKDFINSYFYSSVSFNGRDIPKTVVPAKFYVNNLGFFCKQELKLQAITRLPVKLRLGTVQYCDWMEGKKNAGIVPVW